MNNPAPLGPRALAMTGVALLLAASASAQISVAEAGYHQREIAAFPGLTDATGDVAVDSAGTVYVGGDDGWIYRGSPGGVFSAWLQVPTGAEVEGLSVSGSTLHVSNSIASIFQVDLASPSPVATQVGIAPYGQARGLAGSCSTGDILFGDNWALQSMDGTTGVSTLLSVAAGKVSSVDCDLAGNRIIYADQQVGLVVAVDALGVSTTLSAVAGADGVAVHPSTGDIYVASGRDDEILKIDPMGVTVTTFITGLDLEFGAKPTPLAFSPDGSALYFATVTAGRMTLHQVEGFDTAEMQVVITSPAIGSTGNSDVTITFDARDAGVDPLTITMEYSLDDGLTYALGTTAAASMMSNPSQPIGTPALATSIIWNSFADGVGMLAPQPGVVLRITSSDGANEAHSFAQVAVDNRTATTWVTPSGGTLLGGDVHLTFDGHDADVDPLPATFEFTLDGGLTWAPCTMAPSSPLANPSPPLPTPILAARVIWDSINDGVGLALAQPAGVRITVSDGVHLSQSLMPVVVNNSGPCVAQCGDCNTNTIGPDILDGLEAAQIGVGTVSPTAAQLCCCDVNGSGVIDVLDSLTIAQRAAGLPVNFACP